ncbi:sulfite exporter TauE/SafE family protein [Candidatus Latescibacterota bacterium]
MSLVVLLKLFFAGACAGTAAGFLGIGGGAVLTPLCLLIYPSLGITGDDLVKIIFGTNMFLVTAFSISAVLKHHGNRKIDWRTIIIIGPLAVIGSLAGAWAASITDSMSQKKIFAILLIFSSIMIIIQGSVKPNSTHQNRRALLPMELLPLLGFISGFVGSFLGIGGGVVMIPALILVFAFPVDRVAATSSSVIIFIGLAGMLSYMKYGLGETDLPGWSTGYVWWSAAIPLMLGGVPMARVGALLNAKTHDKLLQRVFGGVLLIIACKILFF